MTFVSMLVIWFVLGVVFSAIQSYLDGRGWLPLFMEVTNDEYGALIVLLWPFYLIAIPFGVLFLGILHLSRKMRNVFFNLGRKHGEE